MTRTRSRAGREPQGATLLELLVVIGIVGLVIGLTLPAVQMARAAARSIECQNRLKSIGLAFQSHHDAQGHYPSDGWGWQWLGDDRLGYGRHQPGGWIFNTLPYLELGELRAAVASRPGETLLLDMADPFSTPVAILLCPSRSRASALPVTTTEYPFRNAPFPAAAARADYAVCAGHEVIHSRPGPPSAREFDIARYDWPRYREASGISFIRSERKSADLIDGASHQLAVGEKCLSIDAYHDGGSLGDDQSLLMGDDADIRRWTALPPVPDRARIDDIQSFGGPHRGGCNFVFADGRVEQIAFDVDFRVFQRLGHRKDRERSLR